MHDFCVIISYWVESSPKFLYKLINQIVSSQIEKKISFPIVLVCNGGSEINFQLPRKISKYNIQVVNRPNSGFNIAAWEEGWRSILSKNYLFLQDDCFIINKNWASAFINKFNADSTLGLLGERINPKWDKPWSELKQSYLNEVAHSYDFAMGFDLCPNVDNYLEYLKKHEIPSGEKADHLQSLVLFTTRNILLDIGGFPLPDNPTKGRAVAAEIAISKKIQSKGYRIDTVGEQAFTYIGHREWIDVKYNGYNFVQLVPNTIKKIFSFPQKNNEKNKYVLLSQTKQ